MSKNADDLTPLALNEQREPFRDEPVKTTQHDSSERSKENAGAEAFWKDPDSALSKEADRVESAFTN